MADWYFQIKGMTMGEQATWERWTWPPLFSGRIEAATSKEARAKIEAEYGTKLPGRVPSSDKTAPYLLHIEAMTPQRAALFDVLECETCGAGFRRIDHYNDHHELYKGIRYCSQFCADAGKAADMIPGADDPYGRQAIPCIYRITHKPSGRVYIGQTRQAVTLRWWQHIKWGSTDCKFHAALRESQLTDWTFEVVEVVADVADLDAREAHHIAAHGSVEHGYNTVKGVAA